MSKRASDKPRRRHPARADAVNTESKIIAATLEALENGPAAVTVATIAYHANVSPSRVYKYSSREELIVWAATREARRMETAVAAVAIRSDLQTAARIRATLDAILPATGPHRARLHIIRMIAPSNDWTRLAEAIRIAIGYTVKSKALHIGNGLLGILRGACDSDIPRDELIADAVDMTLAVHFLPAGRPSKGTAAP